MRCFFFRPMRMVPRPTPSLCLLVPSSVPTKEPVSHFWCATYHVSSQTLPTHFTSPQRGSYRAALPARGGVYSLSSSMRAFSSSPTLWNLIQNKYTTTPDGINNTFERKSNERVKAEAETSNTGAHDDEAPRQNADTSNNPTKDIPDAGSATSATGETKKPMKTDEEGSTVTHKQPKPEELAEEDKIDEDDDEEEESANIEDNTTGDARSKHERLKNAEKNLLIEEIFASDENQLLINTTEVSTTKGLRWLDAYASPEFFNDPLLARIPEGQFVFSVMRKLFGSRFPIGAFASVASGTVLPVTYVNENWACLVLRSAKKKTHFEDELGEFPGSASNDLRYHRHHRQRWSALRKRWLSSFIEQTMSDKGKLRDRPKENNSLHGETASYSCPKRLKSVQQWDQHLSRRLRSRRRLAKQAAKADFLKLNASSNTSTAAADPKSTLRRHRRCSHRPPALTMSGFTDCLTVFIGKELHPVEKGPDAPQSDAATTAANEALMLSPNTDHNHAGRRLGKGLNEGGGKTIKRTDAAETTATHYDIRWRVITVHRSPITFMREMQSHWNKLTSRSGRPVRTMRSVPAESYESMDAERTIKQALRRAARHGLMEEDDVDSEGDYGEMHNTMVERVEGWEDLVRLFYHGAARTLQESVYRNTRQLEVMELEIFDESDSNAQKLRSMTRLMADLHLLSRETTIHNAILRESKVAYQKLKRVLDHPIDLADQRELLYVDSVLSISAHLEEQSASLLFLQFSVAMNQTEQHLRTLTIFTTLFIPLDFISMCFSTNVFNTPSLSESKNAMYAVFGMMAVTAVVTMRWIRRNLR